MAACSEMDLHLNNVYHFVNSNIRWGSSISLNNIVYLGCVLYKLYLLSLTLRSLVFCTVLLSELFCSAVILLLCLHFKSVRSSLKVFQLPPESRPLAARAHGTHHKGR